MEVVVEARLVLHALQIVALVAVEAEAVAVVEAVVALGVLGKASVLPGGTGAQITLHVVAWGVVLVGVEAG